MIFYVIELQTSAESGSAIPYAYDNRPDAEAQYHTLLAVASKSSVPKHGCIMVNADGFVLKNEVYNHEPANSDDV